MTLSMANSYTKQLCSYRCVSYKPRKYYIERWKKRFHEEKDVSGWISPMICRI